MTLSNTAKEHTSKKDRHAWDVYNQAKRMPGRTQEVRAGKYKTRPGDLDALPKIWSLLQMQCRITGVFSVERCTHQLYFRNLTQFVLYSLDYYEIVIVGMMGGSRGRKKTDYQSEVAVQAKTYDSGNHTSDSLKLHGKA